MSRFLDRLRFFKRVQGIFSPSVEPTGDCGIAPLKNSKKGPLKRQRRQPRYYFFVSILTRLLKLSPPLEAGGLWIVSRLYRRPPLPLRERPDRSDQAGRHAFSDVPQRQGAGHGRPAPHRARRNRGGVSDRLDCRVDLGSQVRGAARLHGDSVFRRRAVRLVLRDPSQIALTGCRNGRYNAGAQLGPNSFTEYPIHRPARRWRNCIAWGVSTRAVESRK